MSLNNLVITNNLPSLDLHGEVSEVAVVKINDFIKDNVKLKNEYIAIIHGLGTGKLKEITHQTLRQNEYVIEYKTNYYNNGCTLAQILLTLKQNK